MPLQLGEWKMNSNGIQFTYLINTVDAAGHVTGYLNLAPETDRITGFGDETSQELTFSPVHTTSGGDDKVLPFFIKVISSARRLLRCPDRI